MEKEVRAAYEESEQQRDRLNDTILAVQMLRTEIATLREQEKNIVRIQTIKDQCDAHLSDAERLKSEADRLTRALELCDQYKASMVETLPISGLEITDNVVTRNGVRWEQLNTAQQLEIAVAVAMLRFKDSDFRPIWIEGAEALDSDNLAIMEKELAAHGAQAFIGRVDSGELKAESK
jgi:hypothetical protein